jgi:hypothetical protein
MHYIYLPTGYKTIGNSRKQTNSERKELNYFCSELSSGMYCHVK